MARPPSPAQRAIQITFVLKGHLKNIQLSYLRAAGLLARVRDEKLYAALKHDSLEDYAAARLGLQRAALYRYLQIYDWVCKSHPAWLAPRPKGFIPELSDAHALMWIERQLARPRLSDAMRAELETLRRKALAGKLSAREFQEFQHGRRPSVTPLAAILSGLRGLRRRAAAAASIPQSVVTALDDSIREVQTAIGRAGRAAIPRLPGRAAARRVRRGASTHGRRRTARSLHV